MLLPPLPWHNIWFDRCNCVETDFKNPNHILKIKIVAQNVRKGFGNFIFDKIGKNWNWICLLDTCVLLWRLQSNNFMFWKLSQHPRRSLTARRPFVWRNRGSEIGVGLFSILLHLQKNPRLPGSSHFRSSTTLQIVQEERKGTCCKSFLTGSAPTALS